MRSRGFIYWKTGDLIDDFVPAWSDKRDDPSMMPFTETDPVTLAYTGD